MGEPLAVPVDEAAARMRCSRRRIFQLLADGKLRRVRYGRQTLVGVESIDAAMGQTAQPKYRAPALPGFRPFTRADLQRRRVERMEEFEGEA